MLFIRQSASKKLNIRVYIKHNCSFCKVIKNGLLISEKDMKCQIYGEKLPMKCWD
jgi:hypothetical protein